MNISLVQALSKLHVEPKPDLKPPSHDNPGGGALQKAAAKPGLPPVAAIPVTPQEAQYHDEFLRYPERREAVYRQLAKTDPGLINRLETLQHASDTPREAPDAGVNSLRLLVKTDRAAIDAFVRALQQHTGSADAAERAAAAAARLDPALSSAEQAKADAATVQATYDDTLQRSGNAAQAAQAASAQLDALSAAHASDPVYTSNLLRESRPTLDLIGRVLGEHVDGQFNRSDADKAAIVATVQNLARAAGNSGEFGAAVIAASIAPYVPDKSDLRKLDDAFYSHIDSGGDTKLFEALYGNLKALGKDKAADELVDKHRGLLGGKVGDFLDGVKGVLGAAGGFIKSVAGDVAHIVKDGVELAVDTAAGTVDAIGEGADAARKAVEFAVTNGLKLVGKALEFAIDLYRAGLDKALGISDQVENLEVGDRYELAIDAEVAFELDIQAGRGVSIERTEDGYVVKGYFNAQVDVKNIAGVSVGGGGEITFTADTPEEAQQLALMLASGPKPSEAAFAARHLKAIELDASGAAQLELVKLGIGDIQDALAGAAQVDVGLRLEFDNGKPKDLVIVGRISAEGQAGADQRLNSQQIASIRQLADKLGIELPDRFAANGSVELSFETRIPVGDALSAGVTLALNNPSQALRTAARNATTTVTLDASYEVGTGGGRFAGLQFHAEVSGLDKQDAAAFIKGAVGGDLASTLEDGNFDVEGWVADFTRRDGSPLDINLVVGGQGFAINTEASFTDVDYEDRRRSSQRQG